MGARTKLVEIIHAEMHNKGGEFYAADAILAAFPQLAGWQPIEDLPTDRGWSDQALFAIEREWGWAMWTGQVDDGDIWLGRQHDSACFECDKPTHFMPLPAPPADSSEKE